LSSFLFFSVGAFIPLLPWIVFSTGNVIWWSVALAGGSIIFVGAAVGHFTRRGIIYSALRALIIMSLASAVTFGVGYLVGVH
jgi:VIT1/CCC1 family predicted Fe2+/Mn2+ transporter